MYKKFIGMHHRRQKRRIDLEDLLCFEESLPKILVTWTCRHHHEERRRSSVAITMLKQRRFARSMTAENVTDAISRIIANEKATVYPENGATLLQSHVENSTVRIEGPAIGIRLVSRQTLYTVRIMSRGERN